MLKILAFPKKLRLLTSSNFAFVFQKAQRACTPYVAIIGRVNRLEYPRIGIAIAKKHVKWSHDRNRLKRLTRESFRLHQHVLPAMDFVVIIKKGSIANLNNYTITEDLNKLWRHHCRQYQNY